MKIDGKTFVITGGLGSIGGATARSLTAKGANVIIFDVLPTDVAAERIASFDNASRYVYEKVDVSDRASVEQALQSAVAKTTKGSLFGVVHCAGINPNKPWPAKMADKIDDFEKVLRVNAYGTFVVNALVADAINAQYPERDAFAPRVEEERGVIINLASVVAFDTPARCLTYGASKACVLGITNAAADFLAVSGIRVNSVSPALVYSALMNQGGRAEYFKGELATNSMFPRRFTEATEIADSIVFLMQNSMMNAFHLKVDAGWRMGTNWAGKDPRQRCLIVE